MTLSELIASFRVQSDDTAAPYLWGDAIVANWISEAQREAAVRAKLIPVEVSREIVAGQEHVMLPEEWFDVDSVYDTTNGRYLTRAWPEELPGTWKSKVGRPEQFIDHKNRVRFYPVPTGALSITISGYGIPFCALSSDNDEPEIPGHLHAPLVYWALHRAYLVQDADQGDSQKSSMFLDLFTRAFGEQVDANVLRKRRERRRHVVRMVEYV